MSLMLLSGVFSLRIACAQSAFPAAAVKAVFLYQFAGFVQWPISPSGPFTIAVIGSPEVAAELAEILPDHRIQGRAVQVRLIKRVSELDDAQILYVGTAYHGDLRTLISPLAGRPVLVVTDAGNGLATGGAINFVIQQDHVRFEISTAAARLAGLKISSNLLEVAVRVQTGYLHLAPHAPSTALLTLCQDCLTGYPSSNCAIVTIRTATRSFC